MKDLRALYRVEKDLLTALRIAAVGFDNQTQEEYKERINVKYLDRHVLPVAYELMKNEDEYAGNAKNARHVWEYLTSIWHSSIIVDPKTTATSLNMLGDLIERGFVNN